MPRPYGTDRLEETAGELVLLCDAPKDWSPRRAATRLTPEHPGTAVLWEDAHYEVVEAASLPGGRARYTLVAWDEQHVIRVVARYDPETEEARGKERADRGRRHRRYRELLLAAPLVGLLPAEEQQRFEDEYSTPANLLTLSSALPLFMFGTFCLIAVFASAVGGVQLLPLPVLVAGYYFFIESSLRLMVVLGQGRPIGSVVGEVLWAVVRRVRGEEKPAISRQSSLPGEGALWDSYLVLEPALSFLVPEEQGVLERRFGFEPVRWARITAYFLLFAFGPLFLASLTGILLTHMASDVPLLLVTGYLCVEQFERLRRVRRKEPAPSVLRVLVRPFTRRLLAPA